MKREYVPSVVYVLIFVLATADTHLFVYPSLSQSLLPGLLIALSFMLAFGKNCTYDSPKGLPAQSWFVCAWALYVLLHNLFFPSENYRMYYYLGSVAKVF